jgi:spore photoproduct lyase
MITKTVRKALDIKPSGRSSDYITPSFIHGCLYQCAYCYMRRNKPEGLSIATNVDQILSVIDKHTYFADVKKPNQTHAKYITYDISCNEDFALHLKYHDWVKIFDFFKHHEKAMGTFATKYVNDKLLEYNPERKIRIRYSLMPQVWSDILEPNTTKISDRIKSINDFYQAGYDVHINFSPIIANSESGKLYTELFEEVNDTVSNDIKKDVLAECIMLTHNDKMHIYNLENGHAIAENLLWQPNVQEAKVSSFGGKNIRYKWQIKNTYVDRFTKLHDSIIPWNKIRYIF